MPIHNPYIMKYLLCYLVLEFKYDSLKCLEPSLQVLILRRGHANVLNVVKLREIYLTL